MTNVKSTDPRKKSIVTALKESTGANKITLVKEIAKHIFQGHCLKGNRSGYVSLGTFIVTFNFSGELEKCEQKIEGKIK